MPLRRLLPLLALLLLLAPGALAQERRVALVVGNGAYRHASALANPGNDADGVARTLADLDGTETVGRIHLAEAISYRMAGERLSIAA